MLRSHVDGSAQRSPPVQFYDAHFHHPPTHLDLIETPELEERAPLPPGTYLTPPVLRETFRHSGWAVQRLQTIRAMTDLLLPNRRLDAFANCGWSSWVMRSKQDPTLFRVVPDHCRDRLCVPCATHRRAVIRRNLTQHICDTPHRFLTLTIRHGGEPLTVLIDRLYKAFRRLRQRTLWKERVDGGVALLEIKRGESTPGWHPHLHCILDGRYMDRPALSNEWLICTGDSQNVHLRLIRSPLLATSYVTKYATKPLPSSIHSDPDLLREAIQVLAGRRTIITFGKWRRWKLCDDPTDEAWELYAHLMDLERMGDDGDLLAGRVAAMLCHADDRTGEFTVDLDIPEPDD